MFRFHTQPQAHVHGSFLLIDAPAQAVPEERRGQLVDGTWATEPPRTADAGELSSLADAAFLCRAVPEGERREQR